ncbi:ATP-binding protein [bacterium]|nr:ATP-binding protein [bacterium]
MQLLSFFGRTKELIELKLALESNSLIMITGKPGVGKSSLLLQTLKQVDSKKSIQINCDLNLSLDQLLIKIRESLSSLEDFKSEKLRSKPSLIELLKVIEELKIIIILDDFQNLLLENCIDFLSIIQKQLHKSKIVLISNCLPNISEFELIKIAKVQVDLLDIDQSISLVHYLLGRDPNDLDIIPKEIYDKLNGHPVFINHFASLIAFGSHTVDNLLVQDSVLDQFIIEYLKIKIWSQLNQNQKYILKIFNLLRVHISLDQFVQIYPGLIETDIKNLLRSFLIEKSPIGELYLDPLFKNFSEINFLDPNRELHFQIAQSFKVKSTYYINDLREACFHYFDGKYFDHFATGIIRQFARYLDQAHHFQERSCHRPAFSLARPSTAASAAPAA